MTRKQTLLNLLEQAGERGVTTAEVMQAGVGSRYGARLMELRQDGYVISAERLREGSWRYVLLSKSGAGLSGAAHTAPDLGEQLLSGREPGQPENPGLRQSGDRTTREDADRPESNEQLCPTCGGLEFVSDPRPGMFEKDCPDCSPTSQLFDTPKPKTHRGYGDMEAA